MEAKRIPFTIEKYNQLVLKKKTHKLQQRDETPVVLYTTEGRGAQPLVGQTDDDDDSIMRWNSDGTYEYNRQLSDNDLVLLGPPPVSIGWINFYRNKKTGNHSSSGESLFPTRQRADDELDALVDWYERVACIEVFEGQGLDDSTTE